MSELAQISLEQTRGGVWVPGVVGKTDDHLSVVGKDNAHEFEDEDDEIDNTFMAGAKVVYHQMAAPITVDPNLHGTAAQAHLDHGVFHGKMGLWDLSLNWTSTWKQQMPPYHLWIRYHDGEVAMLSPYLTWRFCPTCRTKEIPTRPCKKCGDRDWKVIYVTPSQFERDCAAWLAKETGIDKVYDVQLNGGVSKAR